MPLNFWQRVQAVFQPSSYVQTLKGTEDQKWNELDVELGYPSPFSMYGWGEVSTFLDISNRLMQRFADYEEMDEYSIISSALDIIADDATLWNPIFNRALWVECQNATIRNSLNDMLERTKLNDNIWEMTRSMSKYGNNYEFIGITQRGVEKLDHIPAPIVRRFKKVDKEAFVIDPSARFVGMSTDLALRYVSEETPSNIDKNVRFLEPWQVAHFRIRSKQRGSLYGFSHLESSRWIWKRLLMLEDSALIYRLTRAPQRYAFYINVGNLPAKQALAYLNEVKNRFKKQKFINKNTGKMDMRFNPLPVAFSSVVPLLDGRNITIKQMADEFAQGQINYVYSVNRETRSVVGGRVVWCGKTRENASAIKVTYDDGTSNVVAPDHPYMLRDGSYIQAGDMVVGDSLMPFYRKVDKKLYEEVYNPATLKYEKTHQLIAEEAYPDEWKHTSFRTTHHVDFNRRNNVPQNLHLMSWWKHKDFHRGLLDTTIHTAEAKAKSSATRMRLFATDPEWRERTIAAQVAGMEAFLENNPTDRDRIMQSRADSITRYNKSDAKRQRTSELNRQNDTKRYIIEYNNSAKHAEDDSIRSKVKSAMWGQNREAYCNAMRIKFSEVLFDFINKELLNDKQMTIDELCYILSDSKPFMDALNECNTRKISRVHRHMILGMLRSKGATNFREYKSGLCNHKVAKIEFVENCDMYCMTVEKYHNFAMLADGQTDSGVFVKNSYDEDFFLPVRPDKGESTRVDVLSGSDFQAMDDIEYFEDKLFAALRVPKAYLGYEEDINSKSTLSSEDVRFARTVMRVQQHLKPPIRQIGEVNLSALNIDPNSVPWEIKLNVPSKVFEIAEIELMEKKANLSGLMKESLSEHWILKHIFGLSDNDIREIRAQKELEKNDAADVELEIQDKQMELQRKFTEKGMASAVAGGRMGNPAVEGVTSTKSGYLVESQREKFNRAEDLRWSRRIESNLEQNLKTNVVLNRKITELGRLYEDILRAVKNNGNGKKQHHDVSSTRT